MKRILQILRRLAGMPDYPGYVAHRRTCHPGEPLLSEREFYDRYLEARYGGAGSRCC
jgi:uncharacterized short protein YbdD (DUF466 family)